jgi:hypothetical protein
MQSTCSKDKRGKRSGRNSFLNKLHAILSNPGLSSIICWSRDGDRFNILDPERLQDEVIPQYFKHRNLKSFVRQLNLHGFKKVRVGPRITDSTIESYRHTLFRQHQPDLLNFIKRKVSKPVEPDDKSEQIKYLLDQKRKLEEKCNKVKSDNQSAMLAVISACQQHEGGNALLGALQVYLDFTNSKQKESDPTSFYIYNLTQEYINNLIALKQTTSSVEDSASFTEAATSDGDSLGKRCETPYALESSSDQIYSDDHYLSELMSEESPFNLDYQDEDQFVIDGDRKWRAQAAKVAN